MFLLSETVIRNFLTDELYVLLPISSVPLTFARLHELVETCNQTPIYEVLFQEKLSGRPYTEENARQFFAWGNKGWEEDSYYVFLALTQRGSIAGAVDIKSSDKKCTEIGYWTSLEHRGLATNMVASLMNIAKQRQFASLFARVRKTNQSSITVLENNSFKKDESWQEDPLRFKYTRAL